MNRVRIITLEVDEDDYKTITDEIIYRHKCAREIGSDEPIIPDGDSNEAGSIIAECIRDLDEHRALFDASRPELSKAVVKDRS